jgi:uroporphyrinogen-III synthase
MSEANKGKALAGKGIVVTRPAHQAAYLAQLIRAAGGKPILFPVIEIVAVDDLQPLLALIDRLDEFDLAVFISPNAVNKAMNLIKARRALPPRLKLAAIGRGSVRELKHFGLTDVIAPARFDSEALLELPEMQDIAGRRVVIFRGDGGRELLGDTLAARGATVEYAECYRRERPRADAAPLLKAWARNELHAITVTSSEGLHNLFDLVGKLGQSWFRKTPLFVPHQRIEQTARELGLVNVVLTGQGDDGLTQGLTQWFAGHR